MVQKLNLEGLKHGGGERGPDDGLWTLVVLDDVAFDGSLKVDNAGKGVLLEVAAHQRGQEALDGIERRGRS